MASSTLKLLSDMRFGELLHADLESYESMLFETTFNRMYRFGKTQVGLTMADWDKKMSELISIKQTNLRSMSIQREVTRWDGAMDKVTSRKRNRQRDQQREMILAYRRRHRQWTMEVLPTMSEADWNKYLLWTAAFGSPMSQNTRKFKRRLTQDKEARRSEAVNAPDGDAFFPYGGVASGRLSGGSLIQTAMNPPKSVLIRTSGKR